METIVSIKPLNAIWESAKFVADYRSITVFGTSTKQVVELLEEAIKFNRVNSNSVNLNVSVEIIDDNTVKVIEEGF